MAHAKGSRWGLRREVLLLTVAIWLFLSAWLLIGQLLIGEIDSFGAVITRLSACVPGILVCFAIYLLLERGMSRPFWQLIAFVLLLGIPGGLVCVDIERRVLIAFEAGFKGGSFLSPLLWPPRVPAFIYMQRAFFWTFFFLSWASAVLALVYSSRVAAEQRMRMQAQMLAHHAMLTSLRYQLNPHFLFNALNSIAALIAERQADEAEGMINRLSDFLRAGLDTDPLEQVPLRDEIAQQRRYLEIERIRFPDRLLFEFDIGPGAGEALVPSLLLQPLVENVIKYAVAPSPHLVTLQIEARVSDDMLHIAVRDDGRAVGQAASGAGIGLDNVKQRLASLFGGDASLQAGAVEGGYEAVLRLPLRRAI
jgi:signal transduction histidine kinase